MKTLKNTQKLQQLESWQKALKKINCRTIKVFNFVIDFFFFWGCTHVYFTINEGLNSKVYTRN